MIKPEKKKESKDENTQVAGLILEILDIDDSRTGEFRVKVNEIYDKLESTRFRTELGGPNYFEEDYSVEKASFILELGLTLKPRHLHLLKYYMFFLFDNDEFRKAIPLARKIIKLEPESCYNWNFLGISIYRGNDKALFGYEEDLGDPEECFKKALELDESYQEAWLNLGMVYKREKKFKDGIEYLEKAIELDGDDAYAIFVLAHVHQAMGNGDLAIETYHKSLEIDPSNDFAWNNLGVEHAKRFEFQEAIRMYVRALQFNVESDVT